MSQNNDIKTALLRIKLIHAIVILDKEKHPIFLKSQY